MEFWKAFTYYLAYDALAALTDPYGLNGIKDGTYVVNKSLSWTDNFRTVIPNWYIGDFYFQYADGMPYKLKAPFDFSFLSKYGKVFKVFDDQDSGNICFGCEKDGKRHFIKFAGAPTEKYEGKIEDAVTRLKATLSVYQGLRHPNLIELVNAEEIGGGYAMVFKWADGECMGRMYPRSHRMFMRSDINTRLAVFHDILSFFEYVASQGYVAIDFYDGSILYDFASHKTTICDIDFFRKMPCVNDIGRIWGSSRFMSPEEFELGAILDEVTNVYTLGAAAFALFADCDRSREAWPLSDEAYTVAIKAVNKERDERQHSIKRFIGEWEAALCK